MSTFKILSFLASLQLAGALALGLTPLRAEEGGTEEGEVEEEAGGTASGEKEATTGPEFKSERYAGEFVKGQALFQEGKYREARSAFTGARRGAKGRQDREAVERWVEACTVASAVVLAGKRLELQQLQEAYNMLLPLRARAARSPAEELFQRVNSEVESKLFTVLEGFNVLSPKYSKRYGKTFVRNPKIVFGGERCLRWRNTPDRKAGMLKVASVPRDWTPYEALEIWVNPLRAPAGAEIVVLAGPGGRQRPATPGTAGLNLRDMFQCPLRFGGRPGQWEVIRIPLERLKSQGAPSLVAVQDLRIQIGAGTIYDFYLDEIRLMRRAASKRSPGRRR